MSKNFKFLHTMIRVLDLEKSIEFYTKNFGMNEVKRLDFEGGRFTVAFVGYGNMQNSTLIELTYNWDQKEAYQRGDAFGHFAIGVDDIYSFCDELKQNGVKITREPGPMLHGTVAIAFAEDPDGNMIEIIENKDILKI